MFLILCVLMAYNLANLVQVGGPELLIHLYFPTYRPVPTRLFIGNCLFGKVKLQFRSVIGPGSGTVSIFPILVGLLFSKMSVRPIPMP